jgi:hypothetical protein
MFNIQEALAQATTQGPDMNEAQKGGGGDYTPPPAGLARLRLVEYIELGQHVDGPAGKEKQKELVWVKWELSGPKHKPKELDDGKKIPFTISQTMPLSLNEKARFYKLFKRLNHTGEARHFAEFLDPKWSFIGDVIHKESGEGTDKRVYANLYNAEGSTIRPPFIVTIDEETGEEGQKKLPADPALSPLKLFLWNFATKDMWDALFIDGTYDDIKDKDGKVTKEGGSKNYFQNRIKAAKNFVGSPVAELLFAGGEPDLPGAETPERSEENKQATADHKAGAAADPLAGV